MEIAISNIAWEKEEDEEIYEILQTNQIGSLDVAPARVFDNPFEITKEQGEQFIENLKLKGLKPCGMQSLLFGASDLVIFESNEIRQKAITHLKKMMDYAKKIGVKNLIFGSPHNRRIGKLGYEEVDELTREIFNELGDYAIENKMYFCIEPNPKAYGTDFITTTIEGIELVQRVNNPGFRLHIDLGTMIMNNENIEEIVEKGIGITKHIHLSHPYLEQVIGLEDIHRRLNKVLRDNKYEGTVSIEMKKIELGLNAKRISETVKFVNSIYR